MRNETYINDIGFPAEPGGKPQQHKTNNSNEMHEYNIDTTHNNQTREKNCIENINVMQ